MALPSTQPSASGNLIGSIAEFFSPQLAHIQSILQELVDSESELIQEVGRYINVAGGKKLRPMICLLVAKALGADGRNNPVELAASLEAVHVATLIHDDVIDEAKVRRGRPSVNDRWSNDVAILMADYLYAAAFDMAIRHTDPRPLQMICQVTRQMCEGEMFQIQRRGHWLTREDYQYIIQRKTAYLFSACAAMGAMQAGLDETTVTRTAAYGLNFGLAFQITDDTLDYTASSEQWGKSVGIDLASGKQTLPLILAYEQATGPQQAMLKDAVAQGHNFDAVYELIAQYGTIEQSLEIARGYGALAVQQIEALPASDAKAFAYLSELPDFIINRNY